MRRTLTRLVRLLTVAAIIAATAINRDGRLLGHDISAEAEATAAAEAADTTHAAAAVKTLDDGTMVVRTADLARQATGYAGPTPLVVSVKDGVVVSVRAEQNQETPHFFDRAFAYLQHKWEGRRVDSIMAERPDGVSGATMSSTALNANIRAGLQEVNHVAAAQAADDAQPTAPAWAAVLLVAALGCVLPLMRRFSRWRTWWLAVNVVVLGLWGGTFLSTALMVNWMANGTHLVQSLAVLLMLVAAFVYPLFGRSGHYCTWICPFGSLQELAGKLNRGHRWRMSPRTVKALRRFDQLLWAALTLLMLTGVCMEWMDYELFAAFLFTTASPVVIAAAVVFVILSVFVPRPYCRFVCPTGCLMRMAENRE